VAESPYYELKIPRPLADLVSACEVVCVAACCGAEAFDVSAEHMVPWMRQAGEPSARQTLTQLDGLITVALNSLQDISSDDYGFAMTWMPADCAAYLGTWRAEIARALALAFPVGGQIRPSGG
jgi:hypothetical protein